MKEIAEVEHKDEEEKLIIIIARLVKKITSIKTYITSTITTLKITLKIDENSLDL